MRLEYIGVPYVYDILTRNHYFKYLRLVRAKLSAVQNVLFPKYQKSILIIHVNKNGHCLFDDNLYKIYIFLYCFVLLIYIIMSDRESLEILQAVILN